ncbi:MAG: MarC family protein [Desulfovibrionaceae bacterium]|nr:MarC family protein [Desulfovibrionaceae bacterium]MBF0512844.1 MarC family protein [Desulfovibrionaceae bacterium]
MHQFLTDFVTLLVVINPISKLSIFLAVTAGQSPQRQRSIALRATLIAFGVLIFFIVLGQILLGALGIGIESFRIAGSLVLLLFGLQMVFDKVGKSTPDSQVAGLSNTEIAVFPLAVPAIAGPGAMLAVVVLTDNDQFTVLEQAQTAATLVLALLITWGAMRFAAPILKLIRPAGANIVARVMGLILASLAVNGMVRAVIAIVHGASCG